MFWGREPTDDHIGPPTEWVSEGLGNLFSVPASGGTPPERLTTDKEPQHATSFSPDGRFVVLNQISPGTNMDIWLLDLKGEKKARPLVRATYSWILERQASSKWPPLALGSGIWRKRCSSA